MSPIPAWIPQLNLSAVHVYIYKDLDMPKLCLQSQIFCLPASQINWVEKYVKILCAMNAY